MARRKSTLEQRTKQKLTRKANQAGTAIMAPLVGLAVLWMLVSHWCG